ncbi:hypothetical protein ACPB9J_33340 [Streptomyces lavendulocolor]|uniref:hypothetical protein n=1 Tax=Streptomyces lavendulocolor TaxID=67316 RepID=UPI003C2E8AD7
MAIEHTLTPQPVASDMHPLHVIYELLRETGHPVSLTTLRRWRKRYAVQCVRRGRADYVSFSDILVLHRELVLRKELGRAPEDGY